MASRTGGKSLALIYAQALYEAALEAKALEQVGAELKALREMLRRHPRFEGFLESPVISFDAKRKAIESSFEKFTKITRNFLLVLVDRKRTGLLETIVTAFVEYSNQKAGIAAVRVHSARKLEESERTRLVKVLSGKLGLTIELEERVRPELLGGLVLLHEDKMWDASVRHALDNMVGKFEALKLATIKWSE